MTHYSTNTATGNARRLFFSEKEWSGFIWLLKAIAVYFALGAALTIIIKYTPAGDFLAFMTWLDGFPVYGMIIASVLGVPTYNLCRAAVRKYPTKSRGLPVLLLILVLFCACAFIPQMILPRLMPIFSSVLIFLFLSFFFLWGLGHMILQAFRGIRNALRGS